MSQSSEPDQNQNVLGITETENGGVSASFGEGSVAQQVYDATPDWLKYLTFDSYTTADPSNGNFNTSTQFEKDVADIADGIGSKLLKYGAYAALLFIGFTSLKEYTAERSRKAARA
ncbi:hypothetical protein WCX49_06715 [Sulfurimonas sp. HSL-1656]|uniref:hypothetical protein n=1 Tax=Thiomicrolovo subterrani TaxID=3131934 RepID=UPI0031F992AA